MSKKNSQPVADDAEGQGTINREVVPVPKQRRIRTSPVTFHVKLNEEQKLAKAIAYNSIVTVLTGKPGTAKSTVACHVALDLLIKGEIDKIIVTRPTVAASHDIGFLPGDAFDFKEGKLAPFIAPILQAMIKLRSLKEIEDMIKDNKIVVQPIQFIRGLNFEDCVVIVDESQNATVEEIKALTTRICYNSRMIFTSDLNQIDLLKKNSSAGYFFNSIKHLDGVSMVELKENFRHPLAIQIYETIDKELEAQAKIK